MEQEKIAGLELVEVTYKAPKEFNDVRVALTKVLEKAKSGEPLLQIAAEELGDLQTAVQGIDQLPVEAKAELRQFAETSGHLAGSIVGILLTPAATAVPTA